MGNVLISNGPDIHPQWNDCIALSYDFAGTTVINPVAAAAAGGQLLDGTTYYYKVVAVMDQLITCASTQLASWTINTPTKIEGFFELNNTGTTRRVRLYTNNNFTLAMGTRTGDGAITLAEVNGSGITGTVTVTYTVDEVGSLLVENDKLVGYEEASATPAGANLSIDLTWDAQKGVVKEYRIYKGISARTYDYFYATDTATFTDAGTNIPRCDEKIYKTQITHVSGRFYPATTVNGVYKLPQSGVFIKKYDETRFWLNLLEVTNQPTWNLGTAAATQQADDDINDWL